MGFIDPIHLSKGVLLFQIYLNPKNSKNKKESTANDDNVTDGFEAGKKSLDHKLQTRCPIDHSQWP